ncbi:MAG: transposase [Phycisphaerales bacterium]
MVIHNRVNTTYDRDMPAWKARAAQLMTGPEVVFGHEQARVCEAGIREVAQTHDLRVHAAAIMRTHLHVVVGSPSREGEDVLKLFKGVLSRRLGQHFAKPVSGKWWTRHGSHRLLTNDASFLGAVRYILREQENPLAIITLDDPETRDQSPAG